VWVVLSDIREAMDADTDGISGGEKSLPTRNGQPVHANES
jgi:hypothetical protein